MLPSFSPPAAELPQLDAEIKDLLSSKDWEEVNQGLELMVSTLGQQAIQSFGTLIDAAALRVVHHEPWQCHLGIRSVHEINAVAKLIELTGVLAQLPSVRLNHVAYPDQIQFDLSLLSGASSLQELIINGGTITGLASLGDLHTLRHLALVADGVEWDADEHDQVFAGLTDLRSLVLSEWPWEDLQAVAGLDLLERLDLRGGQLSSLHGIESLQSLNELTLRDFYSLSSIVEIGRLENLRCLRLLNIGISSLEGLEGLEHLNTLVVEASDLTDARALGSLPGLASLRLEGSQELVGLGALASAAGLRQLKLGDIPQFSFGDDPNQRFGRRELDRLCMAWKDVHIKSRMVNCLSATDADIPVLLVGVTVIEALAGQIDTSEFSSRLESIGANWNQQLRSRAYWSAQAVSSGHYPRTAPIGQWLNRASDIVDSTIIDHISKSLAEQLPSVPERS